MSADNGTTASGNTPNGQIDRDPGNGYFAYDKFAYSLDVVTLLAVIGEQSMNDHSQAINASYSGALPRILPAPQAFLRPDRPTKLPHVTVEVMGTKNGVKIPSVSMFVESLIGRGLHQLKPYSFTAVTIKHRADIKRLGTQVELETKTETDVQNGDKHVHVSAENQPDKTHCVPDISTHDVEQVAGATPMGSSDHEKHKKEKSEANELSTVATQAGNLSYHYMEPRWDSPLVILAGLSFLVTVGDLVLAIVLKDGMGIVAILVVGMASLAIGLAGKWKPKLTTVPYAKAIPPGDVILSTRTGAYIHVKCDEPVTRELFTGTHTCDYLFKNLVSYQLLMATATVFIMVSVIFLGNCLWQTKAAIGGSYIVLNFSYWICSMVDPNRFWDLSRYEVYRWEERDFENPDDTVPAPALYYPKAYHGRVWHAVGHLLYPKSVPKPRTRAEANTLNAWNENKRRIVEGKTVNTDPKTNTGTETNTEAKTNTNTKTNTKKADPQPHTNTSLKTAVEELERLEDVPPPKHFGSRFGLLCRAIFCGTTAPDARLINPRNAATMDKFEKEKVSLDCKLLYWPAVSTTKTPLAKEPRYISRNLSVARAEKAALEQAMVKWKLTRDAKLNGGVGLPSGTCAKAGSIDAKEKALFEKAEEDECFTRAVWYGIRATRATPWASLMLPQNETWKLWLRMAEEHVAVGNYDWKAVNAKNALFEWTNETKDTEPQVDSDQIRDYLAKKWGVDIESKPKRKPSSESMMSVKAKNVRPTVNPETVIEVPEAAEDSTLKLDGETPLASDPLSPDESPSKRSSRTYAALRSAAGTPAPDLNDVMLNADEGQTQEQRDANARSET